MVHFIKSTSSNLDGFSYRGICKQTKSIKRAKKDGKGVQFKRFDDVGKGEKIKCAVAQIEGKNRLKKGEEIFSKLMLG